MSNQVEGDLIDRYLLIPRTLIFLRRDDRVLLIKGAPQKRLWANLYNGIGGHIERGEDVLTAARRELYEETGLKSPDIRLCGTVTIDTNHNTGIGLFVFLGSSLEGEPVPSEEGELAWAPIKDIQTLPLVEDLMQLLPKVLEMKPADPPFSALYDYDEEGRLIISFGEDFDEVPGLR